MEKILICFIALTGFFAGHAQTKVGGVTFENEQKFNKSNLVLNGAGLRQKMWIDLYAGGLYVAKKTKDAREIIEADEPMAVRLQIISGLINSNKMIKAVEEGFESSTQNHTEPLKDRIAEFIQFFENQIKKGDVFEMVYEPDTGLVSYKNGTEKGTIEGLDFKKALFGIWLSNRPADDDLKDAMLGK